MTLAFSILVGICCGCSFIYMIVKEADGMGLSFFESFLLSLLSLGVGMGSGLFLFALATIDALMPLLVGVAVVLAVALLIYRITNA